MTTQHTNKEITTEVLQDLGVYAPRDIDIYKLSVTHRSVDRKLSNERLEFLGDSVLSLCVSAYLMTRYPDQNEGFMTRMRCKLVRGTMLTELSKKTGLGALLMLKGNSAEDTDANANAHPSDAALEDVFEAFLGAIFLDKGYDAAYEWVTRIYETHVDLAGMVRDGVSSKEKATEVAKSRGHVLKASVTAMPNKRFKCVVRMEGEGDHPGSIVSVGEGDTRKEASNDAYDRALRRYTPQGA